jgi:hypothetical protein
MGTWRDYPVTFRKEKKIIKKFNSESFFSSENYFLLKLFRDQTERFLLKRGNF